MKFTSRVEPGSGAQLPRSISQAIRSEHCQHVLTVPGGLTNGIVSIFGSHGDGLGDGVGLGDGAPPGGIALHAGRQVAAYIRITRRFALSMSHCSENVLTRFRAISSPSNNAQKPCA